ncbi:ATP-binding protein [Fulvivirgaceae bacterium BMA12]|uniref:histidine kinase n=1 Tax=Agaribacillus aureus TaxID=3051825 RepID=A0ABT8L5Q7_9BACT|nr:ATP-binding protein [Fulvivirgaceae bacterium BMA12]
MKIDDKNIIKWLIVLILWPGFNYLAVAQSKTMIQVKTYDMQLGIIPDLEVSIDGEDFFVTDNQGSAFVEVLENHLPPKVIKVKSKELEAESWNYSRGVLEIIIRKKRYQMITASVKNTNNEPLKGVEVSLNTAKPVTAVTDGNGAFQMPVPIGQDLNTKNLFSIKGYNIKKRQFQGATGTFLVTKVARAQVKAASTERVREEVSEGFNVSNLDSVASLTAFYTSIKNLDMRQLDDEVKRQIDLKFNQLIEQLKDSLNQRSSNTLVGRITDSSLVKDDVIFLIDQALKEEQNLEDVRREFDDKIKVINKKLSEGGKNLNDADRKKVLSDLERLEKILKSNEQKFLQNQATYKAILSSLKNSLLNIKELEDQLTMSEQQRLEEQQAFQQKIFIVFLIVIGLGLLMSLSIYLARKFKKQKNELAKANTEVKRINQHLEELVSQKTESLEKANKELDTFLYKSSHDLKRPLTSIIGLSNIAKLTLEAKSWELFEKASQTAIDMDKMLQKLMMVNEINHPSGYANIDMQAQIQKVRDYFDDYIKEHKISFDTDVCEQDAFNSFPSLVDIILRNLVENALFYSASKTRGKPEVGIKVHRENGHVTISVQDNGSGIKPEVQSRIWEMFYVGDERSRGNGLGLYIAQKAASVLDGTISFTTEENSFTEFKVILPDLQQANDVGVA